MSRVFQRPSAPVSGQKVFLATPTYDKLGAGYTDSLFHSSAALSQAGIASELCILQGDCHVDDARNFLVRNFLESDCTDLVFLDADVAWKPSDLVELCQYNEDVVAGLYPLKSRNEAFPVRLLPGGQWVNDSGLLEVESVPTGFLRIRRSVLEKLAEKAPKYLRNDDPRGPVALIFERTLEGNTRWGGDYTFCRKWRALGGKIYIAPEMEMDHYGDAMFSGSVAGCLRRQHGLTFNYAFAKIKQGNEPFSVYTELVTAWDNKWSMPADMLSIVAKLGRDAGSVVEFGSGLTTAVLARVCDDVTAHEHDPQWLAKTAPLLEGTNAELILSPLENGFYSGVSGKYDLAVCDGPPRGLSNGRAGLYALLADVLKPGGKFIIDDLDSDAAVDAFKAWADVHKPTYKIVTGARTFVVGRMQ
jgi:SAM-dependent methyltransferase